MHNTFVNEALVDFTQPVNQEKMRVALQAVAESLGQEYPLVIGGQRVWTEEKIASYNPSQKDQVVGYVSKATADHVELAMIKAQEAFSAWKNVDPNARAATLFRAAAILRRRKFEYAAWMIYETGKNWVEADADVAEAIDFMEFYGREMIRLGGDQPLTRLRLKS